MHPHFTGLQGVIEYFHFMDLEDQVLGVFKQVAHNVIKCLQREPCMPYEDQSKEDEKGRLQWVVPSATVVSIIAMYQYFKSH